MKKLAVSMFIMVAASFFFVCGASAAQHDVYAGFSVPSTFTFTDTISYNVGNRSYGTAAYIDITWSWADYRNFYNSKGASISVAGADFYGDIELISVSASDPTIDCSLDGNRIRIYFNSNYNGNLNITLTYACNYTWYVGTITGIPAPADSLQDVTLRTNFTLSFGNINYYDSQSIGMGDLNAKLNQILDALDTGSFGDYLGEDALFYFDYRYFTNGWVGSSVFANSNGYFVVQSPGTNLGFGLDTGIVSDTVKLVQLTKGSYIFSFSGYFETAPSTVTCNGVTISDILVKQDFANPSRYFISGVFTFDANYFERDITFGFDANLSPGIIWGGIARAPDDYLAGSAVNPDQSGLVEDVDNAGQQQQQQEEQLWTNINSYKGDLTFNLDDWSEAAGGLSYVSGIFMSIWNNSPTQVIVLSLMLGIAMLSIGRGAMAAVRVSRNRRNDD